MARITAAKLKLDTLGLDPVTLLEPEGMLLDADILDRAITPRPKTSTRDRRASVGVLGGAAGMVGAALIAGCAALKCGAGRGLPWTADSAPPLRRHHAAGN